MIVTVAAFAVGLVGAGLLLLLALHVYAGWTIRHLD
jgi:hypothetical protein